MEDESYDSLLLTINGIRPDEPVIIPRFNERYNRHCGFVGYSQDGLAVRPFIDNGQMLGYDIRLRDAHQYYKNSSGQPDMTPWPRDVLVFPSDSASMAVGEDAVRKVDGEVYAAFLDALMGKR